MQAGRLVASRLLRSPAVAGELCSPSTSYFAASAATGTRHYHKNVSLAFVRAQLPLLACPKPYADSKRLQPNLQVVDHYERPRNVGTFDKNDEDVGTGLVGAPACGDVMRLQIKVGIRRT